MPIIGQGHGETPPGVRLHCNRAYREQEYTYGPIKYHESRFGRIPVASSLATIFWVLGAEELRSFGLKWRNIAFPV